MTSRAFSNRILRSAAAIATLGLTTFIYANQIELRAFKLHRVQVPVLAPGTLARAGKREGESFRILHVSDFHMLPDQKLKQKWVASLDALNPDLVINTGDNLGSDKAVPSVLAALGPLLNRPGAFVFGTNDYFAPRPVNPLKYLTGKKRKPSRVELPWRGMRAAFIEHGWQDATHARLEFVAGGVKVALSGVDDPHHELEDYSQIAGAPNADADIAIGLSHSPEPHVLDAFADDGYDLVLSGHTHGGQVCLPGGKAIVTNCGIDRSRASGLSRWTEKTWLHVSNGLGTSPYAPVRLFCRPSATLIEIVERDS
ncbi:MULTISPECIES: metallophosphoesterase [Corynebacterium]|uniref:Metallophosphoesterase n=1 Tax=Corynebacterium amycolatum TaxID=43765 RepID=A0AB38XWA2_CORAY|nr:MULTISPECIES: metallophosphoesterase [Corynebacterium]AIN81238.1 calcineurin-like phosphoesterase family protein [Corynebacterium sp. ATCC 6931]MBC6726085.1 metallophosphoesterase [Corynebacterium amycolatum]MCG7244680.1 metallophosphoesterase [Corynebacterium sp. ACRPX]MDY7341032.1 metallophosphoesterase [Corynebacterium amycolatum]OFR91629.1 metallophosphoesterase [Corynebacterium sp. HMSC064E10]